MTETINWATLPNKDKTRLIITDVLGWQCFDTFKAFAQTPKSEGTYPIALLGGDRWIVFSQPDENGSTFDPLHNMQDAWQIVLHLRTVDQDNLMDTFADALVYSLLGFLRLGGPEEICIAALKAVGYQITNL